MILKCDMGFKQQKRVKRGRINLQQHLLGAINFPVEGHIHQVQGTGSAPDMGQSNNCNKLTWVENLGFVFMVIVAILRVGRSVEAWFGQQLGGRGRRSYVASNLQRSELSHDVNQRLPVRRLNEETEYRRTRVNNFVRLVVHLLQQK